MRLVVAAWCVANEAASARHPPMMRHHAIYCYSCRNAAYARQVGAARDAQSEAGCERALWIANGPHPGKPHP